MLGHCVHVGGGAERLSSAHRGLDNAGYLFVGNVSNHGEDKSVQDGSLSRKNKEAEEDGEGKVPRHRGNLISKQTVSLLPLLSAERMWETRATNKEEVSLGEADGFEKKALLPKGSPFLPHTGQHLPLRGWSLFSYLWSAHGFLSAPCSPAPYLPERGLCLGSH